MLTKILTEAELDTAFDENELNVVGEIRVDSINWTDDRKPPRDATYISVNKNNTVNMCYKIEEIKFNDGDTTRGLSYLTSRGTWHGSNYNKGQKDYNKLKDLSLLKLIW